MIEGLYLPPKPAIIIPATKELLRPEPRKIIAGAPGAGMFFIQDQPLSATIWDSAKSAAGLALSNSNKTGTFSASAAELMKSDRGYSSGHRFAEITITNRGLYCNCGVANASASTAGYVGSDANGYGYFDTGSVSNNATTIASGYASYVTNDVIGIYLNMDVPQVSFYKNGTLQGTVSIAAGTWYLSFADGHTGVSAMTTAATVNGGTSAFTGSIPAGALKWG